VWKPAIGRQGIDRQQDALIVNDVGHHHRVGAVITLMSVGEGVQAYITTQFQSIGSNLFFVIPGSFEQELKRPAYLTLKDAEALMNPLEAPDVLRVAPLVQGNERITPPVRTGGWTSTE
jgi:hypothetical protein